MKITKLQLFSAVIKYTVQFRYSATTSWHPKRLWRKIPYYKSFWFTATLDIAPQIAAGKQWRYKGLTLSLSANLLPKNEELCCNVWVWNMVCHFKGRAKKVK